MRGGISTWSAASSARARLCGVSTLSAPIAAYGFGVKPAGWLWLWLSLLPPLLPPPLPLPLPARGSRPSTMPSMTALV